MNIFKTIDIIYTHLNSRCRDKGNPLYGINIETDPYKQLEACIPFVLIEENISKFITNPQGCVYEYQHLIDLTCVVSSHNQNREKCFQKVSEIAENIVAALGNLADCRFRIIPKETIPGEVIIGSLQCSAVRISIEVKTLFVEN
jgi:hypothetical protein